MTISISNGEGKLKQTISIQMSQGQSTGENAQLAGIRELLAKKMRQDASVPKDRTGTPFVRNATELSAG